MTLKDYYGKYGPGTLQTLAKDSGISLITLRNVVNGLKLKLYPVARAISKATGWRVSIPEMCEEGKPPNSVLAQFAAHSVLNRNKGRHRAGRKR